MKKKEENQTLTFQMPFAVVDSGALGAMSGGTYKVYGCLCRHRHFKRGTAWPSSKTIIEETRVKKATVFRALRWLIACGLIERRRGPKSMNFVNIYTIILEPVITIPSCPFRGTKKKSQKRQKTGKFAEKGGVGSPNDTPSLGIPNETPLLSVKGGQERKEINRNIKTPLYPPAGDLRKNLSPKKKKSQIQTSEKDFKKQIDQTIAQLAKEPGEAPAADKPKKKKVADRRQSEILNSDFENLPKPASLTKEPEKKRKAFKPHERTNLMKEL